jgi:hypothetical protein
VHEDGVLDRLVLLALHGDARQPLLEGAAAQLAAPVAARPAQLRAAPLDQLLPPGQRARRVRVHPPAEDLA